MMTNWEKYYTAGRNYIKKITGSSSNACAAVMSYYCIDRGYIDEVYTLTAHLQEALQQKNHKIIVNTDELRTGDICFSADLRGVVGAADHVYLYHSGDGHTANVFDNYSPKAHTRNLRKGSKTPFAFAIRMDV